MNSSCSGLYAEPFYGFACVCVFASVFDYRSGEATGPWWPRQPQASQVSEPSIPLRLLHSCENRRAAWTTNTRGTGGKTANLRWLINNSTFLLLPRFHMFFMITFSLFQCLFLLQFVFSLFDFGGYYSCSSSHTICLYLFLFIWKFHILFSPLFQCVE